jgi:prepilin-type N-terminal cleavage/methylation domain-containing protein
MRKNISGFTVVELLVVIVVIGILAGIILINYGSAQRQTKITVAQTDLQKIADQLEGFRNDTGAYPPAEVSATYSMDDMANVLKDAKLYEDTRGLSGRKKSFIYCVDSTFSHYIVAALEPVYPDTGIPLGKPLYYASSAFSGARTMTATDLSTMGANICKSISGDDNYTRGRWSFDIPLPGSM